MEKFESITMTNLDLVCNQLCNIQEQLANLVAINSPVCNKFREHRSKKPKKSARGTNRDVVSNE